MCGIVACVAHSGAIDIVLNGLKVIQNRGYDSMGISYIQGSQLKTVKYASRLTVPAFELLRSSLPFIKSTIVIGHTRWATHGGKTNENAHPHTDYSNRISLVHNGIIENFAELKKELLNEGYSFKSETDTEVVAVMIGKYMDTGLSTEDAIRVSVGRLEGTWALVIMNNKNVWLTRHGSPLLIGKTSDNSVIVGSEKSVFTSDVSEYVSVSQSAIVKISTESSDIEILDLQGSLHLYKHLQNETSFLGDFKHWMLKEICEQPETLMRCVNYGGRFTDKTIKLGGLESLSEKLREINNILLVGCGTSYHSALWASYLYRKSEHFDIVVAIEASDFDYNYVPRSGKTAVILISQSGETRDVYNCLNLAKSIGLSTIGVVNVVDSMIARETDCGVYLNCGRENAVASTKSFTAQCVVLTLILGWWTQNNNQAFSNKIIDDFYVFVDTVKSIIDKRKDVKVWCHNLLKNKFNSILLLGRNSAEAVAREGALKIKEVSYLHAEGLSASSLKHGTIALIESGFPVIFVYDKDNKKNESTKAELLARDCSLQLLETDSSNLFSELSIAIQLQLVAYYLAVQKGYNPDFPRNLAKVVTVD